MKNIKTAIAQKNFTVGDLRGNSKIIIDSIENAKKNNVEIVVFPELSVTGYFPKDLLFNKQFIEDNLKYLDKIVNSCDLITALVGFVNKIEDDIYNSIAVIQNRKIVKIIHKTNLSIDEKRYFAQNEDIKPVNIKIKDQNVKIGIEISEDFENNENKIDITRKLAENGAEVIFCCSASPYYFNKLEKKQKYISNNAKENNLSIIYTNLVGGQDDLIYDGNSFAVDEYGNILAVCKGHKEEIKYFKIGNTNKILSFPKINKMEELYNSLVLGISDYFRKTGFKEAILGLSGGIDSALVAVLVSEAIGSENVYCYALPSEFSSNHSIEDSEKLAKILGINYTEISIKNSYNNLLNTLGKEFEGTEFGIAEENLQARIRGTLLMSIANKFDRLVLTTGNKTEINLGYFTLYGDSAGALAPISDLNKLEVYALSNYINKRSEKEIIPQNIITKKPSAELKNGQYDPFDYEIVSPLVDEIINNNRSKNELLKLGYNKKLIDEVIELIRKSEYKRHQLVTGLKVSETMVHKDRKMPIVNKYTF
ncbi:MAG: NAD+ synthase [Candidatus Marinimicrobia bacterium]|nr:NAD+ synthase [Candidatus Neomarinimicrobiota bacterium]